MFKFLFLLSLFHGGLCGQTAFQATLQSIEDGLIQLDEKLPGKARQIAINNLLKTVSASDKLDPDGVTKMTEVKGLIEQVKNDVLGQLSGQQQLVDTYRDTLAACSSNMQGDLNSAFSGMNNKSADMLTAWTVCYDQYVEMMLAKDDWLTFVSNDGSYYECQPMNSVNLPNWDPTQDAVDNWWVQVEQIANHYTSKQPEYAGHESLAITHENIYQFAGPAPGAAENVNRFECRESQEVWMNSVCHWYNEIQTACNDRKECTEAAKSSITENSFNAGNQERCDLVRILNVLLCILEALIQNQVTDADATTTTCLLLKSAACDPGTQTDVSGFADIYDTTACHVLNMDLQPKTIQNTLDDMALALVEGRSGPTERIGGTEQRVVSGSWATVAQHRHDDDDDSDKEFKTAIVCGVIPCVANCA